MYRQTQAIQNELICNQGLCRARKSNLFKKKENNTELESRNLDESVGEWLITSDNRNNLYSLVNAEGNGTNETWKTDLIQSKLYFRKKRFKACRI